MSFLNGSRRKDRRRQQVSTENGNLDNTGRLYRLYRRYPSPEYSMLYNVNRDPFLPYFQNLNNFRTTNCPESDTSAETRLFAHFEPWLAIRNFIVGRRVSIMGESRRQVRDVNRLARYITKFFVFFIKTRSTYNYILKSCLLGCVLFRRLFRLSFLIKKRLEEKRNK